VIAHAMQGGIGLAALSRQVFGARCGRPQHDVAGGASYLRTVDSETLVPLVFAAAVIVVSLVGWLDTRATREKAQAWQRAAEKLGGTFVEHAEASARNGFLIEGEVRGTRVWAMLVERYSGDDRTICTEVHATTSAPGLKLCAYRRLRLAPPGSGLSGVRAHATGDPAFDAQFVVKANDETLARFWLDAAARARMVDAAGYAFVIEDCGVRAIAVGVASDTLCLVNAAEAVAALARGGLDLLDTVAAIGEVLGAHTTQRARPDAIGGFEVALALAGATVVVDLVHQETGTHVAKETTWTRIRAESSRRQAPFVAVRRDAPKDALEVEGLTGFTVGDDRVDRTHRFESADPASTGTRLDATVREHLLAASPTVLADDGAEVAVLLTGVGASREVLSASVALVLALTVRGARPYR
jgi:hypothetical protein